MVQKNKKFSDFKKTRKNVQKFDDFKDYRKKQKDNRHFNFNQRSNQYFSEGIKPRKNNKTFNNFWQSKKNNKSFNNLEKPRKKYNSLDDFKKYRLLKQKRKFKNYNLEYRKFNRSNRPPKRDKHQITRYLYRQVKLRKGIFLKVPAIQEIVYPFKLNLKLINEYLKKK